eukprot:746700-Hanusia_phi.AAC.3
MSIESVSCSFTQNCRKGRWGMGEEGEKEEEQQNKTGGGGTRDGRPGSRTRQDHEGKLAHLRT